MYIILLGLGGTHRLATRGAIALSLKEPSNYIDGPAIWEGESFGVKFFGGFILTWWLLGNVGF